MIEAETPKAAMQARFKGREIKVSVKDLDIRFVETGNPQYSQNHFTAMWTTPFDMAHREIVGCPLGSNVDGAVHACADLVDRTNRESHTNFRLQISSQDAEDLRQWGRAAKAAGKHATFTRPMSEARTIIDSLVAENLDSMEGGVDGMEDYYKGREWMRSPEYIEAERRRSGMRARRHTGRALQFRPTPHKFADQWPKKPDWHLGHRSSRMSLGRNTRRKGFGYTDVYSLRDRGWPYANRGFDQRTKKYQRALNRFGEVEPGEGI